jgi:hypothetical protein
MTRPLERHLYREHVIGGQTAADEGGPRRRHQRRPFCLGPAGRLSRLLMLDAIRPAPASGAAGATRTAPCGHAGKQASGYIVTGSSRRPAIRNNNLDERPGWRGCMAGLFEREKPLATAFLTRPLPTPCPSPRNRPHALVRPVTGWDGGLGWAYGQGWPAMAGKASPFWVPTAQGPPRMELSPCPGAVRKQE